MDAAAFEPIFQAQLEQLLIATAEEGVLPLPHVRGRLLSVPVDGIRKDGRVDRFVLALNASGFPLHPFDAGFVDPQTSLDAVSDVNLKDPRWFPFDGETSFKVSFQGARNDDPKVFICVQPGFSREYFHFHVNETWNPHVWSLARVVAQVRQALNAFSYVQPNWERS